LKLNLIQIDLFTQQTQLFLIWLDYSYKHFLTSSITAISVILWKIAKETSITPDLKTPILGSFQHFPPDDFLQSSYSLETLLNWFSNEKEISSELLVEIIPLFLRYLILPKVILEKRQITNCQFDQTFQLLQLFLNKYDIAPSILKSFQEKYPSSEALFKISV
jgi:hypothetical protein